MADTTTEVTPAVGSRDKGVPWYNPSVASKLSPVTRKLFEEYSHIPTDEVESHILKIRDEAWEVWPFPCIGNCGFLDLSITESTHFPSLVQRLVTEDQTFLDLGCCFGQDLRALAAAGVPSTRLYATDLRPKFWELGYKLFNDRETLQSRFIGADVLAEEGEGIDQLRALNGTIDVIMAGSFLHLFDYEGQVKVCERIVALLKPVKGSVVLGRQVGSVDAVPSTNMANNVEKMYRHNVESFEKMWAEVGRTTGSKWRVDAVLESAGEWVATRMKDESMRRLTFAVFRE